MTDDLFYEVLTGFVERPNIFTNKISQITSNSVLTGGQIYSNRGHVVTEKGICWSTHSNPTIMDNKINSGTGNNSYTVQISGLNTGSKYYVKAYAINSEGISYGSEETFTTLSISKPNVVTSTISIFNSTSATVGGNVTSDGGATITERGVYWSTNPLTLGTKLQIGNGTGAFSTSLTGLSPNTIYYIKAFATNSQGTGYGTQMSFTTGVLPVAAFTGYPTTINTGQSVQFTDQSTNSPTSWSWNFGDGSTSTTQNPTHNYSKAGSYNVSLSVSNSAGSNTLTKTNYITVNDINGILFNPNLAYGNVTDIDGNIYKTIQIGDQVWMAENLKVTKLNDGTAVPFESSNNSWMTIESARYCWYNNDIENNNTYGALYNRYAVNTGKLCPVGWHVSTDSNWSTLARNTGGDNYAAIKLKETGSVHWSGSSSNATNASGFTALPGGMRNSDGSFNRLKNNGVWWCTNPENYAFSSWFRLMIYDSDDIQKYGLTLSPQLGLSVRCVKDSI